MRTAFALAALAACSTAAFADLTLSGGGSAGWQAFPSALNNYSNPARAFWDQDTMDRAGTVTNRNIGNYLHGSYTGGLPSGAAPSPGITPQWWGNSASSFTGTMDANITFSMTGGTTSIGATLNLEVAGFRNANEFGWYSTADAPGTETLNAVFIGASNPPTYQEFTPTNSFGLYIRTGGGHVFFSESSRNRNISGAALAAADRTTQHFAIFASSLIPGDQQYRIGIEDLHLAGAGREVVGDYNDMVVTMSAIPSPGVLGLLGLSTLATLRRRR